MVRETSRDGTLRLPVLRHHGDRTDEEVRGRGVRERGVAEKRRTTWGRETGGEPRSGKSRGKSIVGVVLLKG